MFSSFSRIWNIIFRFIFLYNDAGSNFEIDYKIPRGYVKNGKNA